MQSSAMTLADIQRQFPRSAGYDLDWVMANHMGPNVLWLTEALTQVMQLKPGMRLLDLGCGKALSSIFAAKEFGIQVWATDLWIGASENWQRICAAGMQDSVFPIHAEARSLPFADEFFDAIISMDAYHYFGTDDLYLGNYLLRLLKPGGQIGVVVPGLTAELEQGVPEELKPYWEWDFCAFHSPPWWRRRWENTPQVQVELADMLPGGWQHWLVWLELCQQKGASMSESEATLVRLDAGRTLAFTRIVGRKVAV
jgi:SAM-dependent methyltransferase